MTSSDPHPALVRALLEGRSSHSVCWTPASGIFFDRSPPDRTTVLEPRWLIDDGNLVLAVVKLPETLYNSPAGAARAVEKTGRLLDSAILDAGLHRLLVMIVLAPEGAPAVGPDFDVECRGQFRVLVHTGREDDEETSRDLALRVEPLEKQQPFLKSIDEQEDVEVAAELIRSADVGDSLRPLRAALEEEVRRQLTDGTRPDVPRQRCLHELRALLPHSTMERHDV